MIAQDTTKKSPATATVNYRHLYQQMLKIRIFEENANQLYLEGKMPGLTHMYSGQEAIAVGICENLSSSDYITSTHRGHGHCLAKGARLDLMFAELLGKAAGYCRGKGGSMHIADQENGNLGANAIVGGSAGIATGAALSAKMLDNKRVSVCFFGDGALGQGLLYETMNMASLWQLPVIYVCENNLYGEYTHYSETLAGDFLRRGEALAIGSYQVDGQDVLKVGELSAKLIEQARNGKGPSFLLCDTYRYYGHHVGDIDRRYYRSKEEEDYWQQQRDPLKILAQQWQSATAEEIDLANLELETRSDVKQALDFALQAPYPGKEEVSHHVYAN